MIDAVIRRFRQRRRVKRELREEAVRLERHLKEQHRRLRVSAQRNQATLDALSEATPRCPSCGAKLAIKTAMVKGYNGRQFWGCSRHPRCGQEIIELDAYPRAAYAAITRKSGSREAG